MAKKISDFKKDIENLQKQIESIKNIPTTELKVISQSIVDEMKSMISKGISPIRGNGRFPGYKDPKKYPANVRRSFPDKRQRPVNLNLSGKFLKNLKGQTAGSNKISIGFTDALSQKKEMGHRDGANGQLKRPIIPEGNETFEQSIQKLIDAFLKKVFPDRLKLK